MAAIGFLGTFQAVSRDAARARECPPVPKCTRLVPAKRAEFVRVGNSICPFAGLFGSPLTDSNRRPPPYHGGALPTELRGRDRTVAQGEAMQGGGFEPPKAEPAGLQPAPFGHSGTPAGWAIVARVLRGLRSRRGAFRRTRRRRRASGLGCGDPSRSRRCPRALGRQGQLPARQAVRWRAHGPCTSARAL